MSMPVGQLHPQDPPPPPERSRTGRITGLLEVLIAVVLVTAVIAGIAFWQREKIPFVAELFPTVTPEGKLYSNPAMGIRLYYPSEWIFLDGGSAGIATFSNSQAMLDGKDLPADGILLLLIRRADMRGELPADVDPHNPEDLIRMLLSGGNGIVTETAIELEALRSYTVNGKAAASITHLNTGTEIPPYVTYLVVIATDDVPVIAVTVLNQTGWEARRPAVDEVLNTLEIQPME